MTGVLCRHRPLPPWQRAMTVEQAAPGILVRRDGGRRSIRDVASPVIMPGGAIVGAVLAIQDVTSARALQRDLEYVAMHDTLTGLKNRVAFEAALCETIAEAAQRGEQHASLYIDLDRFKIVNDIAGHAAGDALLKKVGKTLRLARPCQGRGRAARRRRVRHPDVALHTGGGRGRGRDDPAAHRRRSIRLGGQAARGRRQHRRLPYRRRCAEPGDGPRPCRYRLLFGQGGRPESSRRLPVGCRGRASPHGRSARRLGHQRSGRAKPLQPLRPGDPQPVLAAGQGQPSRDPDPHAGARRLARRARRLHSGGGALRPHGCAGPLGGQHHDPALRGADHGRAGPLRGGESLRQFAQRSGLVALRRLQRSRPAASIRAGSASRSPRRR